MPLESVRRRYPCQTRRWWYPLVVAEPSKETAAGAQGIYSVLRRVPQAGDPRVLRPRLDDPEGQLHRAADRLGHRPRSRSPRTRSSTARAPRRSRSAPASLLALRIGLRYALGGPLGPRARRSPRARRWSRYFIRNQKDIVKKVGVYKTVIADAQKRYDEVSGGLAGRQVPDHRPQPHDRWADEAVHHPGRRSVTRARSLLPCSRSRLDVGRSRRTPPPPRQGRAEPRRHRRSRAPRPAHRRHPRRPRRRRPRRRPRRSSSTSSSSSSTPSTTGSRRGRACASG